MNKEEKKSRILQQISDMQEELKKIRDEVTVL